MAKCSMTRVPALAPHLLSVMQIGIKTKGRIKQNVYNRTCQCHQMLSHVLTVPKPGCFKPGCLQFLRGSALLRSFAPFCGLLCSFADLRLRSFARICAHLRVSANDRVQNDRVWELQNVLRSASQSFVTRSTHYFHHHSCHKTCGVCRRLLSCQPIPPNFRG